MKRFAVVVLGIVCVVGLCAFAFTRQSTDLRGRWLSSDSKHPVTAIFGAHTLSFEQNGAVLVAAPYTTQNDVLVISRAGKQVTSQRFVRTGDSLTVYPTTAYALDEPTHFTKLPD